jgi:hypothetical protein
VRVIPAKITGLKGPTGEPPALLYWPEGLGPVPCDGREVATVRELARSVRPAEIIEILPRRLDRRKSTE